MSLISRAKTAYASFQGIKEVHGKGGAKRVRLVKVDHPRGLILSTAEATLDVETRSGETVRISPALPVPFLYAWGWRIARRLGVPFVSTVKPEQIHASVPVPKWLWPGADDGPKAKA